MLKYCLLLNVSDLIYVLVPTDQMNWVLELASSNLVMVSDFIHKSRGSGIFESGIVKLEKRKTSEAEIKVGFAVRIQQGASLRTRKSD